MWRAGENWKCYTELRNADVVTCVWSDLGKRSSSHIVREAAPASVLILQSPATRQRIMHISHRYKRACTWKVACTNLTIASLSPGLWPGLRATEITAQQCFWTLGKLATSVKISYRFSPSHKFFLGDVPISFCGTRTSVINVYCLKYFMILWMTLPLIHKHYHLCPFWRVLKHGYANKGAVTGAIFSLENLNSFCWIVDLQYWHTRK